jgi:hypothetical protein
MPTGLPLAQRSTAANDSSSSAVTPGYSWLQISAFTSVPLAGADIAVYDSYGNALFRQDDATNEQGVFPAHIKNLPRDFRVTVTLDGDESADPDMGAMGRFTLSADVRDFDPAYGVVYVDPATTLVSQLLGREPRLSLHQARTIVRRYLVLPRNADLGSALRQGQHYQSPYFLESAFVTQARQKGGMEPFLNCLMKEMLSPPYRVHAFTAPTAAAAGPVAIFIGKHLASAAFHFAAGEGFGWAMAQAGLVTPGATPEQIEQLQKSLADLQSSVDNLNRQLDALTAEVRAKLTETQYQQIVVPALALASNVNAVERNLSFFAQGCPPLVEEASADSTHIFGKYCKEQKETIRTQLNDVRIDDAFGTLSIYLLDKKAIGFKGMIHLYSQSLGEALPFFRPADSTRMQDMFDYWISVQTQAANLHVERLHLIGAQKNPGGRADLIHYLGDPEKKPPTLGIFQNTLAAEGKLMFPAVPGGTVIDTRSRRMWLTAYPKNTSLPNCRFTHLPIGIPPGASYFVGSWTHNGLYWHTPTSDEAKELIKGWTGTSPNAWLTKETQAVAPGLPESRGFANLIALNGNGCTESPSIFIKNPGNFNLRLMDLRSGAIRDHKRTEWDWLFMTRPLNAEEQYYWYSNQ